MSAPFPGLDEGSRVVVLGASGWFGSEFRLRMPVGIEHMLIAGRARGPYVSWNADDIKAFRPTHVVNFAFLTAALARTMAQSEFKRTNSLLTERFLAAAQLPTVEAVMTVSSGAAVTNASSPYGKAKLIEEESALDLAVDDRQVVVLRAYSVSGAHVRSPREYAFSDLICQARQSLVKVRATRPTFRRYVSVGDALDVAWRALTARESGVIETGGELVEMRELARRIVRLVNPSAEIVEAPWESDSHDVYASDNVSWLEACQRFGTRPKDLHAQILDTNAQLECA